MKKIGVNFVGFGSSFNPRENRYYNIMNKYYDVHIDDVNPDYIICGPTYSAEEGPFPFCRYNGIRIMVPGENNLPNFNVYDYAIQYADIQYGDRYFHFPPVLNHLLPNNGSLPPEIKKYTQEGLLNKDLFCDFIYRHDRDDGGRKGLFECISSYKPVCSCGSFLNNMPNGETVNMMTKIDIQKRCKFSIAVDSVSYPGFVTEKILDAFIANAIPIYRGDPEITKVFNEKAFVNCNNKANEEILEIIKEIDTNQELYKAMLDESILAEGFNPNDYIQGQEDFFRNIIDQKKELAYRRPMEPWIFGGVIKSEEETYKEFNEMARDPIYRAYRRIKRRIRKK